MRRGVQIRLRRELPGTQAWRRNAGPQGRNIFLKTLELRIDRVRDPAAQAQSAALDGFLSEQRVIQATQTHPHHQYHVELPMSGEIGKGTPSAASAWLRETR